VETLTIPLNNIFLNTIQIELYFGKFELLFVSDEITLKKLTVEDAKLNYGSCLSGYRDSKNQSRS
jgi:hypothetical protein